MPTCCYWVSLPAVVGFQVRIILVTCMDLYRSWLRIRMDAMNIFKWSSFGAANLSNLINDCVTFGHWSDWHIGLAATALAAQMVFKSRPWNSQRACRSGRHRIRVISFILVLSCVDHINLPYVLLQIPLIHIPIKCKTFSWLCLWFSPFQPGFGTDCMTTTCRNQGHGAPEHDVVVPAHQGTSWIQFERAWNHQQQRSTYCKHSLVRIVSLHSLSSQQNHPEPKVRDR